MAHTLRLRRSRSKYGKKRRQRKTQRRVHGGGIFDDFISKFKPSTDEEKCAKAREAAQEACSKVNGNEDAGDIEMSAMGDTSLSSSELDASSSPTLQQQPSDSDSGALPPQSSDSGSSPTLQQQPSDFDSGALPPPPSDSGALPPPPYDSGALPPPPSDSGSQPQPVGFGGSKKSRRKHNNKKKSHRRKKSKTSRKYKK
jgi:hypothetical protein